MPRILAEAHRLLAAGRSVIPIRTDGTKAPCVSWKPYQRRHPTAAEWRAWSHEYGFIGLALVAGRISGNLEILDFDAPELFEPYCAMIEELCPGLIARLPLMQTPTNGRHLSLRCTTIQGNLKLACRAGADGRPEVCIETRGEGGYALIPPSPPACHPLRLSYQLLRGDLAAIPAVTPDERTILLNAARSFNTYVPPERIMQEPSAGPARAPRRGSGTRPGDDYNARAAWQPLLTAHGWTEVGQHGGVTLWKRPGKRERGISATTNYADTELLYVFSSNAAPFEPERAYNKFGGYALLEHAGNFAAAARTLAARGYGASEHRAQQGRRQRSATVVVRSNGLRVRDAASLARRFRPMAAEEVARWRR